MPNDSYFQGNPIALQISRSKMTAKPRWTGSFDTGKLIPIFATSSIMPGDTFSMSVSSAVRLLSPRFPTMDDMDITIEAYFVPHRLVLSRKSMAPAADTENHSWEAFIGAQDSTLNMPTPSDIKLPHHAIRMTTSYLVGGLADCLGYPIPNNAGYAEYSVNCLKTLAYYSIWNEYWREPNLQSPVTFNVNSANRCFLTGSDAGIPVTQAYIDDIPCAPVSRYHGYFGSALPWPQRNLNQVALPLGTKAPVLTSAVDNTISGAPMLHFTDQTGDDSNIYGTLGLRNATAGLVAQNDTSITGGTYAVPANLYADLSQATAATINAFRAAIATQEWYEHLARGGNKYPDLINSMYGVRGKAIDTRPEYLGGMCVPLSVAQVAATAATAGSGGNPGVEVGSTGAFSLSNPGGYLFSKSFTEHGTLMVVACVRVKDSFSQGIQREDTKFDRLEFYWPCFASLGEQEIKEKEIYVTGTANADNAVFGYQEAWAEYRYFVDQVRGYANPVLGNSGMEYLTYGNNFSSAPTLPGFLDASGQKALVDRSMTLTSQSTGFQFMGQFQFNITMVRPMPLYSIPASLGHH